MPEQVVPDPRQTSVPLDGGPRMDHTITYWEYASAKSLPGRSCDQASVSLTEWPAGVPGVDPKKRFCVHASESYYSFSERKWFNTFGKAASRFRRLTGKEVVRKELPGTTAEQGEALRLAELEEQREKAREILRRIETFVDNCPRRMGMRYLLQDLYRAKERAKQNRMGC